MFLYTFFAWLIVRLLIAIAGSSKSGVSKLKSFKMRTTYRNGLFVNSFIDSKALFVTRFKRLANIGIIRYTDSTKAYAMIMEKFSGEIEEAYHYSSFSYDENRALFYATIFVLKDKKIVEIGFDYTVLLYTSKHYSWATTLLEDLANCRVEERTKILGFARPEVMN